MWGWRQGVGVVFNGWLIDFQTSDYPISEISEDEAL